MKPFNLLEELVALYEKIQNTEVIDEKDLFKIKQAIYKVDKVETRVNCLVKAAAEAIRILTGYNVSTKDFDTKVKGGAVKGSDAYEKIHPNRLKDTAAKGIQVGSAQKKLHLTLDYINTKEDIMSTVKRGVPVILSIVWTDLIFYPVVYITRPKQRERIQSYKDLGATPEMMDAVMKDSLVPYPNKEVIQKSKEIADPHASVRHAVLVIGYDRAKKAFICRDYSIHNGDEMGIFKVDERIFFDPALKAEGMATVEAGLVIEVEHAEDA